MVIETWASRATQILRVHIRNRQGIYALFRRGKLYYVGLAKNLRGRLQSHLRDRHGHSWDRFSVYLTIGNDHMRELEALLLRISKPAGNKVTGKFAKSENLLSRLRRDLRRQHEAETTLLLGGRAVRPAPERKKRAATDAKPRKSKATGRRPILAPYISRSFAIRSQFKGKTHRAKVRKDGTISYKGRIYNSPSLAGNAVQGHACNGWDFWTYERSPGDWVFLAELRKR